MRALKQPVLDYPYSDLCARVDLEFVKDVLDVGFRCALGDLQLRRDLPIREPAGDQLRHFPLAGG